MADQNKGVRENQGSNQDWQRQTKQSEQSGHSDQRSQSGGGFQQPSGGDRGMPPRQTGSQSDRNR